MKRTFNVSIKNNKDGSGLSFGDVKSMIDRLNSGGKTAKDVAEELEKLQQKGCKIKIK